jgi:hypothetical protein
LGDETLVFPKVIVRAWEEIVMGAKVENVGVGVTGYPFSSLLLPLLEAGEMFGRVVMAVVVMVVVVVRRLFGSLVISYNLKKIISNEKNEKRKKTYRGLETQSLEPSSFVVPDGGSRMLTFRLW